MIETPDNQWTVKLQDAILDNSALRENLTDDEAQPFIDWGLDLAVIVTDGMDNLPPAQAEVRYEELYGALPKLMTRINWVATYREKKGAEWTVKTLDQLNELNCTLFGENAPQLSPEQITTYANQYDGLSGGEVVKALMHILYPPAELPTTPAPPTDVTDPLPSETPPPNPTTPQGALGNIIKNVVSNVNRIQNEMPTNQPNGEDDTNDET